MADKPRGNIVRFPSPEPSRYNLLPGDDGSRDRDPCELRRRTLQMNRDWAMKAADSHPKYRAAILRDAAAVLNPEIEMHNRNCPPRYRVELIPIVGPSLVC